MAELIEKIVVKSEVTPEQAKRLEKLVELWNEQHSAQNKINIKSVKTDTEEVKNGKFIKRKKES